MLILINGIALVVKYLNKNEILDGNLKTKNISLYSNSYQKLQILMFQDYLKRI